jgi:hypothetical protein
VSIDTCIWPSRENIRISMSWHQPNIRRDRGRPFGWAWSHRRRARQPGIPGKTRSRSKIDDFSGNSSKFWAETPPCLGRRNCCGGASGDDLHKIRSGFGKANGNNRHFTLCIGWLDLTAFLTSLTNRRENGPVHEIVVIYEIEDNPKKSDTRKDLPVTQHRSINPITTKQKLIWISHEQSRFL